MPSKPKLTPEQYLEIERRAEGKSEYCDGEMHARPGGTGPHCTIAVNVMVALGLQLRDRPDLVFGSDLRVLAAPSGLYTYPDVCVVCGEPRYLDATRDVLLNPTVIVEVLSPSTEAYDRGAKFKRYREIESLRAYLLVSSDSVGLELFTREPDGRWTLSTVDQADGTLALEAIGCTLLASDVYEKVEFGAA
jgi:Uma2 family endonuclease